MKRLERVKAPEFRIYYTSFFTPIGRIYLAATQKAIFRVSWGYRSAREFVKELRKIAIKNLTILQTCDLAAILRYRRIFAPHRIGDIRLVAKMASASSGRQLAGFPKNQSLFLGELPMIAMPQKHRQNPPHPSLSSFKGGRIKVKGLNFAAAVIKDDAYFTSLKNDMLKYFSGEPVSFKKYAIFLDGTDFQKKVWEILLRIPYGRVLTYKQVAEKINMAKAVRAVGGACGANELPIIIPCHRVMASNGGLGGFSGGLGLKRQLLKLEGVKIK